MLFSWSHVAFINGAILLHPSPPLSGLPDTFLSLLQPMEITQYHKSCNYLSICGEEEPQIPTTLCSTTNPAILDGIPLSKCPVAYDKLTNEEDAQSPSPQLISVEVGKLKRIFRLPSPNSDCPEWYPIVQLGLGLTVLLFFVDIGILSWGYRNFNVSDTLPVVNQGTCLKTSKIMEVVEIAVNIPSTLLHAASNNCSQLLMSPTRSEVDKAYDKGAWVHIRVGGFHNLRWVAWRTVCISCVLWLSSNSLHLMYL